MNYCFPDWNFEGDLPPANHKKSMGLALSPLSLFHSLSLSSCFKFQEWGKILVHSQGILCILSLRLDGDFADLNMMILWNFYGEMGK